jgi:hypothetical protein
MIDNPLRPRSGRYNLFEHQTSRSARHEGLRHARLEKDMSTAEGRRFLATNWLSLFPFDDITMFALQARNETAPEGEKVEFISTLQEEEARRP